MVETAGHNISRYKRGCRCDVCRAAGTKARARQRATQKTHTLPEGLKPKPQPKVVGLPSTPQPVESEAVGENEAAVRAQCGNSKRADDVPAIVSQAITLAKILDNPDLQPMHPQTSRQLASLLASLDGPKRKMKSGHLAVVSRMAGRQAL